MRGSTPLSMLPPTSDRDGNVYVLFGGIDVLELGGFIGHRGGGWTGGCEISAGVTMDDNFGAHGFVGRAQSRAWYWSNVSLVGMNGVGGCSQILPTDPTSGSQLRFIGVLPWVRETPSRTSLVAYIQTRTDPRPFIAVIDLNNRRYTSLDDFDPNDASNVTVLGVGAHEDENEGVAVVRYNRGEQVFTEARFYDHEGEELEIAPLGGLDGVSRYGIVGYVQPSDTGLWAGLTKDGRVLTFDRSGGEVKGVGGMTPVGVHRWEGNLYVVGYAGEPPNTEPRFAPIEDDGDIDEADTWEASLDAQDDLGEIDVIDDRSLPSRDVTWENGRTAMGFHPFLHPHSLDHYADGTTTWLVAGPSFPVSGQDFTAVAFAPVGIAYE